MSEIKGPVFKVDIIESELGWGQKVDETKYFDSKPEAEKFIKDYNEEHNSQASVPSWYMYARKAW